MLSLSLSSEAAIDESEGMKQKAESVDLLCAKSEQRQVLLSFAYGDNDDPTPQQQEERQSATTHSRATAGPPASSYLSRIVMRSSVALLSLSVVNTD